MTDIIGDHDPIPLYAKGLGHWVECECGWIGPSSATETRAMDTHAAHVERVS